MSPSVERPEMRHLQPQVKELAIAVASKYTLAPRFSATSALYIYL